MNRITGNLSRQWAECRWRFLLVAVLGIGLAGGLHAQPAAGVAQAAVRVDRHYNALHSLEVHFVQTYTGMGMNRKESGVLLLKKPGKMRWTYTDPDGKLFILDGKYGYFYSPGATEAQKVEEKKLDDLRSPLRFLLGHTELQKELDGLHGNCDASGTCELAGVPKHLEQRIASLKITAAPDGTIRSMTIEETDGVTNRFEFSGEAGNVPAADAAFQFVPPPGVHVVEGEPPV
ncbi:MAG TPA: outer membrane lipoprotein chaperone LolA [Acidobacteriaceae bacterium]|nr:outer membrane lipoprotein chaperone LolA [Acidobacteriaceae bacterium]HWC00804.1 outer membrane lipoprotein chaperone LolA [Bryobacteraceae bacterium]